MTRIIKFRAWDKIRKKMVMVDSIHFPLGFVQWQEVAPGEKTNFQSKIENLELMQFTDLKDKNGKEIYEGDIVKYLSFSEHKEYKAEVYFRSGCFLVNKSGLFLSLISMPQQEINLEMMNTRYYLDRQEEYLCEIIGNIYENLDLLK